MLIKQVKGYKLTGINQIPAEFIQAGGRRVHSQIHKLCKFQACKAVSLCLCSSAICGIGYKYLHSSMDIWSWNLASMLSQNIRCQSASDAAPYARSDYIHELHNCIWNGTVAWIEEGVNHCNHIWQWW